MMGVRCWASFLDFLDDFSACCLADIKVLGWKMGLVGWDYFSGFKLLDYLGCLDVFGEV
jgi:hypothetical protein